MIKLWNVVNVLKENRLNTAPMYSHVFEFKWNMSVLFLFKTAILKEQNKTKSEYINCEGRTTFCFILPKRWHLLMATWWWKVGR